MAKAKKKTLLTKPKPWIFNPDILMVAVKAKRSETSITIKEAAIQAGLAEKDIWNAESGQLTRLDKFAKLLTWLDVGPENFFTKS